jgi:histone acetyltransferase HTATIP
MCIQKVCPLRTIPPPGVCVYTNNGYSIYEIDGEKHKLYAQNLCLFSKLFLDTKSVFYDATTFLYYLLVAHEPSPDIPNTTFSSRSNEQEWDKGGEERVGSQGQVVGFFSKEKMSWDNNNLACILVFPPWQKQGLGQILMGASYEMSRREERLGGPEKRTSPHTGTYGFFRMLTPHNSAIRSRSHSIHPLLGANARPRPPHLLLEENPHRPRSA